MGVIAVTTDRTIEIPGTYPLQYSPRLVRTKADFYDTVMIAVRMSNPEMIAAGKYLSPPSAGEEHQIYLQRSTGAKNLQDVDELKDYFGKNDENWYAWGWTLTGLRFREADLRRPYNIGDKITAEVIETDITPYLSQIADPQFTRDNWKDIIDKVNQARGELAVPYSRGHVVSEMHPTFGIFTEVKSTTDHKTPYALHSWLRENLYIQWDSISGHYDVAVGRKSTWPHDERCMYVVANFRRRDAASNDGFRPVVRG